jgi:hypothetical protein
MARPRLGNHHHHRVRQRAAGEHEQLERVVEHCGIRAVRIDDRQDLLDVFERFGFEQRLACMHPVRVAAHGIDLAVVRDIAVWMRAVPARKRVRGKARMDQRERRFHRRVVKILKIFGELLRQQHAFVDQGLVRQARDVP